MYVLKTRSFELHPIELVLAHLCQFGYVLNLDKEEYSQMPIRRPVHIKGSGWNIFEKQLSDQVGAY